MAQNAHSQLLASVDRYYSAKVKEHGRTSRGVDWNSLESQELRFAQLLKVTDGQKKFSINDFGCGFGSLLGYLNRQHFQPHYYGFDISKEMIANAKELYKKGIFRVSNKPWKRTDYSVASGIFNVRLTAPKTSWKSYFLKTLDLMDRFSARGFSFNCLTKYSDKEKMRNYLYYADPLFLFDVCKKKYSKNVALLHDYGLYEFTILVRKDL
jgi:SAM-dependent methyltransferase